MDDSNKKHTYPLNYIPGRHWATDKAWEILDRIRPGLIKDEVRAFLVGEIAGSLIVERNKKQTKIK